MLDKGVAYKSDMWQIEVADAISVERIFDDFRALYSKKGALTIFDLYSLAGIEGDEVSKQFGWEFLGGIQLVRSVEGYLITLPQPVKLNKENIFVH